MAGRSTMETTMTTTTTPEALTATEYPHRVSDTGYTVIAVIMTIVWIFGTLFNVTSLSVFVINKHLCSPTNMFVIALNVCDLLMSFVASFLVMTSAWKGGWMWGHDACVVEGFTVYFLGLTSMYLLAAISFDRYVVIAKPLLGQRITHKVAGLAIGGCWLGGAVWSIMPLFGWNEYVLEGAGVSCSVVWESRDPSYTSYIFTIFVFCLCLPLVIMAFSYYNIYMTIRSVSRNQNWDKNSRIAKKNLKVERKMAKTIALMIVGFLGCWLPYAIFSFIVVFKGSGSVSEELATYPAILAKSQGLINPLIYVASNRQFRSAFCEMLPCDRLKEALRRQEDKQQESDDDDDDEKEDDSHSPDTSPSRKTSNKGPCVTKDPKNNQGKAPAIQKKGSKTFQVSVHPRKVTEKAGDFIVVRKMDVEHLFKAESKENVESVENEVESLDLKENQVSSEGRVTKITDCSPADLV